MCLLHPMLKHDEYESVEMKKIEGIRSGKSRSYFIDDLYGFILYFRVLVWKLFEATKTMNFCNWYRNIYYV